MQANGVSYYQGVMSIRYRCDKCQSRCEIGDRPGGKSCSVHPAVRLWEVPFIYPNRSSYFKTQTKRAISNEVALLVMAYFA